MLKAMNAGGIHDHLGGGYARYSTDAEWLVPHFEKMLYDNAQILELLAFVHSLWPDPTFAERAHETVEWLNREMRVGDAFAASLDADQDGEEGLYTSGARRRSTPRWATRRRRSRPPMTSSARGKLGRPTVLRRVTSRGSPEDEAGLAASRAKLFALAREASETRPRRQGAGRLERPDRRRAGPRQRHVRRAGVAEKRTGRVRFCVCQAARRRRPAPARLARRPSRRACAASTIMPRWPAPRSPCSKRAASPATSRPPGDLAYEALDLFGDGAGGFYLTAKDAADVPGARPRQTHDGATPSGVGLLAETFVRLWHLTDEPRWREAAEGLIRAVSGAPGGAWRQPAYADERRHAGARRLGGDRRAARRSGGSGARRGRAPRARPVADRAAPRPQLMAKRPAARRPATHPHPSGDAVPGSDLLSPGRDAGSAHGADYGALGALPCSRFDISAICVKIDK